MHLDVESQDNCIMASCGESFQDRCVLIQLIMGKDYLNSLCEEKSYIFPKAAFPVCI